MIHVSPQAIGGPRAEGASGGEQEEGTEHPHVLPLIEALADGRHLYLVFPYADGGELFEVRCLFGADVWVGGWGGGAPTVLLGHPFVRSFMHTYPLKPKPTNHPFPSQQTGGRRPPRGPGGGGGAALLCADRLGPPPPAAARAGARVRTWVYEYVRMCVCVWTYR